MLLGVNYIIRGTDHITNTAKQVAIWSALNQFAGEEPTPLPRFAHVGLIYGANKKKLSKRDGAASMLAYREQGYTPEAMLNFILRLGWGGKEIPDRPISKKEAVELFFKGQMKAAPAGLDPNKLNFFQKFYSKRAA
jgi:glutamyl-tRNA synthetase